LENGLREVLDSYEINFKKKFKRFYEKRRSAASHGHIDIFDPKDIEEAIRDAKELEVWVRNLLVSFLNKHQISISY
jgi:uncharacterized membrane protein